MVDLISEPLKQDVARERILDLIRTGGIEPGHRLQPERELARMLSMNTRTIRQGLDKLAQEGVIERRARAGNFVRQVRCREGLTSIAVVFPEYLRDGHNFHPTIGAMLTAISSTFDQLETTIAIYWYGPGRFWLDAGQAIVESGSKGVLLFPHGSLVREDLTRLQDQDIKIALLMQSSSPALDQVRVAGVEVQLPDALDQLMRRLIAEGHRDIAVGVPSPSPYQIKHTAVLERHRRETPDLPPMRDLLFDIDVRDRLNLDILPQVLERRPMPTAIVVPDEVVARAMFRLLYRAGLRVPQDISLAAVVDSAPDSYPIRLAAANGSRLTVEMGRRAAALLQRQLDGETVDIATIRVPCEVEPGESIGPPTSQAHRYIPDA
jgi:DNA-binding LacI/PurR family transcriptional regulator